MRFRLDNVPSFGPYAEIQETTCGAYLCSHGHGLATSKLKVEMYTSRILLEIYNSSSLPCWRGGGGRGGGDLFSAY
jgi:hypothetical protein